MMGYRGPNGAVVFSRTFRPTNQYQMAIPCGQCVGCRLEHSRQWAVRCMHEAQMHEASSFVTLTYDDEHLPKDKSLHLEHWTNFAKRLRKQVGPFRFLHCGEYGDKLHRPHYHACIFGLDFIEDREQYKKALFLSPLLNKTWGMGFAVIGSLTFESAAYVSRYVVKKITGKAAEDHYQGRKPEYATMSRRPGLGQTWFNKYHSEVYPSDEVIVRGKKCKPPRYYDKLLEKQNPELLKLIKDQRKKAAIEHEADQTWERLKVREEVQEAKIRDKKRELE